jgi:GT2 family glycosyltransferase
MKVPRGDLDVVVVNWNTGGYLADCLESVYASAKGSSWLGRVIVVDNASTDGSLELAAPWLREPQTVLVRNAGNRGFGVACNQGARAGTAALLLFLNPDARLAPGVVERIGQFLASPTGSNVGICGVRILDDDGRPGVVGGPFPTPRLLIGHMTGLWRVAPSLFPRRHPPAPAESQFMDHVIGAFLVIRRQLFEQVNGFDERYFMYHEEIDLCQRCRELGWLTFYLADVHVFHASNVSSDKIRAKRLFYVLRSRHQYGNRHWTRRESIGMVLLSLTVELLARMATEMVRRRRPFPGETLAGYLMYLRYLLEPRLDSDNPGGIGSKPSRFAAQAAMSRVPPPPRSSATDD